MCPELPRGFISVVERAMRVKPEERYADARTMREELESVAFAAGLPVGPGSLTGYVRAEGETVSVSKSSPRARGGGTGAQAPAVPASRAPAARALPGGRKVWAPVAGVVVGLALSLAGGAFVLSRQAPAPVEPPAPVPPVATPTPVPAPPTAVAEAPVPAPAPEPAPEPSKPSESPVAVAPVPEVRPEPPSAAAVTRPKRESKRSREQAHAAAAPAPAPAPAEEVLSGEGALRIGAAPGVRGQVKLPGRGLEEIPLDLRRWKAGRYALQFISSEGTASCEVKVLPERRTLVVFDGKGCSVTYRD